MILPSSVFTAGSAQLGEVHNEEHNEKATTASKRELRIYPRVSQRDTSCEMAVYIGTLT